MVTRLLRPSFKQGLYSPRSGGFVVNPNLWRGLKGAFDSVLGNTGITFRDISDRGNHCTLTGAVWGTDYIIFDGSNDEGLIINKSLTMNDKMTIVMRFRTTSTPGAFDTLIDSVIGGVGIKMFYDSGNFNAEIQTSGGGTTLDPWDATAEAEIVSGNWVMLALTADTGTVEGFINGIVNAGGATKTYTHGAGFNSSDDWRLCARQNGAALFYPAEFKSLYLYDRILSRNEIMQLHVDEHALFRTRQVIGRAPVVVGVTIPIMSHHYTKNIGTGR